MNLDLNDDERQLLVRALETHTTTQVQAVGALFEKKLTRRSGGMATVTEEGVSRHLELQNAKALAARLSALSAESARPYSCSEGPLCLCDCHGDSIGELVKGATPEE